MRASRLEMSDLMNRTCRLMILVWLVSASSVLGQRQDAGVAGKQQVEPRIRKSLKLLSSSARVYTEEQECFSCHHQALPVMTLQLAQQQGIQAATDTIGKQAQFTREYYQQRQEKIGKGGGIPGGSYSAGYALLTLAAANSPADSLRDAMVQYLRKKQNSQGHWSIGTHRPPLEDSDFTATAVSLAGIHWADRKSSSEERQQLLMRARGWLRATRPKTTEDRVFQLFGLAWAQVGPSERLATPLARRPYQDWLAAEDRSVAKDQSSALLKLQREDGGWAQLPTLSSDAYATGEALCSLYVVGALSDRDEAFRRGIQYLLKSQREDGSWQVSTRSKPIQTYFESGFPHGKSQFISIAGSSWATMALLLSLTGDR